MLEAEVTIVNRLGLHARAAGKLVNLAKTFESSVTLARDAEAVDAKSIMAVMLLAAPIGTHLTLRVDGDDEASAMEAIRALIANRFGEDE